MWDLRTAGAAGSHASGRRCLRHDGSVIIDTQHAAGTTETVERHPDHAAPEPSAQAAGAHRQVIAEVASGTGGAGRRPGSGTVTRRLPPGAVGAATLLGIQRTAGNRAAAGLVAQRSPERGAGRDPDPEATPVQRNGEPHTAPLLSATALTRAQAIRGTAQARLLGVGAYNTAADRAIASYRDKRTAYASRWGRAWERHSTILSQAGEQAATENMVEGVVIGVVAGLVIAAAATVAFPAAAGAAAFSAGWWAFNVGTGVASGLAGTGAGAAVGRPDVGGPSSGRRDAEADAWQAIAQVEATARSVATTAPKFGLELGNAEYAIAQVQAHIDGGTTDMNWDQTLNMVSTLANWENGLSGFDGGLENASTAMTSFDEAITGWEIPSVGRLEREIWYAWMAQLRNDEVLDQDAIQQHLVGLGLIPDYTYMSDEDQHRAVADARRHVAAASEPPGAP